MALKPWPELPEELRRPAVRPYYDCLARRGKSLFAKRALDCALGFALLVALSPLFLLIALFIKLDSKGPVFFRQARVTQYGRLFTIYKFRTMVVNAQALGAQVTVAGDKRVTRAGRLLRGARLDELPQLINIILGDMSFVGTRPEAPKYVARYTDEMRATLLLPAGLTSEASIRYKDEAELLKDAQDADETYVNVVLPQKMAYNLRDIERFSLGRDLGLMFKTVAAVLRR